MADTSNLYNSFFRDVFGTSPIETQGLEGILDTKVSQSILNAKFPRDFEYYQLSLELVKVQGDAEDTVLFFSFPVLPSQISEVNTPLLNVYKTAGGVGVTDTSGFVPVTIQIDGNFGRSFKVINPTNLGNDIESIGDAFAVVKNSFKDTSELKNLINVAEFSTTAKRGYGAVKVLEKIYQLSKSADEDSFYKLFLYNPILGNNYVVKFQNFKHFQSLSSGNMIPSYSMTLTAISPADTSVVGNFKKNITQAINRAASNALSSTTKAFNNVL